MNLKSKAKILLAVFCVSNLMNFSPVFARPKYYECDSGENNCRMTSCGVVDGYGTCTSLVTKFLNGEIPASLISRNRLRYGAVISYIFQKYACKMRRIPNSNRVSFIPKSDEELSSMDKSALDSLCNLWIMGMYSPDLAVLRGYNILHYAALYGSEYVARKLVDSGIDLSSALEARGEDGRSNTPATLAGFRIHKNIYKLYSSRCPDGGRNTFNAHGRNAEQNARATEINLKQSCSMAPIVKECEFNPKLLKWCQFVNEAPIWDEKAEYELSKMMDEFLDEFVAKYREIGGINAKNKCGNTLLHSAVSHIMHNYADGLVPSKRVIIMNMFIGKLVDRGIDPSIRNDILYTPFSYKRSRRNAKTKIEFLEGLRLIFRDRWGSPVITTYENLKEWIKKFCDTPEDRQNKMKCFIIAHNSNHGSAMNYVDASIILTAAAMAFVLDNDDIESFEQFVNCMFELGVDDTACILIPEAYKIERPDYTNILEQAFHAFRKIKVNYDFNQFMEQRRKRGEDANFRFENGNTILHQQVRDFYKRIPPCGCMEDPDHCGNSDVLTLWGLCLKRPEINFDFDATNDEGLSALDLMVEECESDDMIRYWARLFECTPPRERFMKEIGDIDINNPGNAQAGGGTVLHMMINRYKNKEISKMRLLRYCGWLASDFSVDLDMNKKDNEQLTASELLKKIFPDDKELQLRFECVLKYGFTDGMAEADREFALYKKRNLRRGVRRNRDDMEETSVRSPAFNYLYELLEETKDINAPINVDDPYKGTLLHWAIRHYLSDELNDEELLLYCKMLLNRGLDGKKNTLVDEKGNTLVDEQGDPCSAAILFPTSNSEYNKMRSYIQFICAENSLEKCTERTEEEIERVRNRKHNGATEKFSDAFMQLMRLLDQTDNINAPRDDAFGGTLLHLAVHWYAQKTGLTGEEMIIFLKSLLAYREFNVFATDSKNNRADECLDELCGAEDDRDLRCRFHCIVRERDAEKGEECAQKELMDPENLEIRTDSAPIASRNMKHTQDVSEAQVVCKTPNKICSDMNSERSNSPKGSEHNTEIMKQLDKIDISNGDHIRNFVEHVVRMYYEERITPEFFGEFCLRLRDKFGSFGLDTLINTGGSTLKLILESNGDDISRKEAVSYVQNLFEHGLEEALNIRKDSVDFDPFLFGDVRSSSGDDPFMDSEDSGKSDSKSDMGQPSGREDDEDSIDLFNEDDDKLLMEDSDPNYEDDEYAIHKKEKPEKKKIRK